MPTSRVLRAIGLAAVLIAFSANGQPPLTVIGLDFVRTDRVSGDTRHEVLPLATFEEAQIRRLSRPFVTGPVPGPERVRRNTAIALERNSRREVVLRGNRVFHVLHRGQHVGDVDVSEIYGQMFHCAGNVVGSGEFAALMPQLPQSESKDSVWALLAGRKMEYETQAFVAISGDIEAVALDSGPLVVPVEDPEQLERYAEDVGALKPRNELLPLGEDETRAYRLDAFDAVVVVRKRRSAERPPGPVQMKLLSPLMTDIAVVRNENGERVVHAMYLSDEGQDTWGRGFADTFMDAFTLGDGNVYLAFERLGNESTVLRLFKLGATGGASVVFEDELYGC